MKKIMLFKLKFWQALTIIIIAAIAAAVPIGIRSVQAFTAFGGRITMIKQCVLDTPAIAPVTCAASCPLCTGVMGTACVSATEITFAPAGGFAFFVCPSKAFLYKGGYPRIGGFILGNMIIQSAPFQIGVR